MPLAYTFDFEDGEFLWAVEDTGGPMSLMIGRDPGLDVPVPDRFNTVSRTHARLVNDGNSCWIQNHSMNLTWAGGAVVPYFSRIQLPCEIRLGSVRVRVDRCDVGEHMLHAFSSSLPGFSADADVRTAPIEDVDWRGAVQSLGITAHWATAFFCITQQLAQAVHPDRIRESLGESLTHYLGASEVRISLDVFPDSPEAVLEELVQEKSLRENIRALSPGNPVLRESFDGGRRIVWALCQNHDGVPRVAVAAGTFGEESVLDAGVEEAGWLVLAALQMAMPVAYQLRQIAVYEAERPLSLLEPPSHETLKAAEVLNIRGNSKAFQECIYAVEIGARRYLDFEMGDPALKVILLRGEIGSGKSALARLIHRLSARRNRRFLYMNAAAIVSTLAEMELFGMCRGARDWPESDGLLGEARDATVFLDEIGNLDRTTQDKLLTVLSTGIYQRVGEPGQDRVTNAHLIMAANQNLEAMAEVGRFNPALLSRIRMFTIDVPPLRERKDEIRGQISDELARIRSNNPGCELNGVSSSLMNAFLAYDWPYNIRELLEVLRSAAVFAPPGARTIDWEHLRPHHRESLFAKRQLPERLYCDAHLTWEENERRLEREYVAGLLAYCDGKLNVMKEHSRLAAGTLNEKEKRLREYLRDAGGDEVARIRALAGKGWHRIDPDGGGPS